MTKRQFINFIRNLDSVIYVYGNLCGTTANKNRKNDIIQKLNEIADQLELMIGDDSGTFECSGNMFNILNKNVMTEEDILRQFKELKESNEDKILIIS